MIEREAQLAAARAAADRQMAHVSDTVDTLVVDARALLAANGTTEVWALTAQRIKQALSDRPDFIAEMLAVTVVQRASQD